MATQSPSQEPPAIESGRAYTLPAFRQVTGLGLAAMRTARRRGLRVRHAHGKAFVVGADFLDYLDQYDRPLDPESTN